MIVSFCCFWVLFNSLGSVLFCRSYKTSAHNHEKITLAQRIYFVNTTKNELKDNI